ncbi:ParA family protein [Pontibacterium sp.]|uniref:ParA family protein n=1 Tax=Pontibacterium sp. TaxID=2036026 RepID=UPI0035613039
MATIGFIKQKGGVGCSTLAFATATEYTRATWDVLVADLDTKQTTCFKRQVRRANRDFEPHINVQVFPTVDQAIRQADKYDLTILDTAPHATRATAQVAEVADLLIIPTGLALDDLEPTVKLAHELRKNGISQDKIAVAFCRTSGSEREYLEAKEYIEEAGYYHLDGQMHEKPAFRIASDLGRSPTESQYKGPREQAIQLVQSIIDRFNQIAG